MKLIKGVFIDGFSAQVLEIEHSIHEFHQLLDCDIIDITMREISGQKFWIICDDCGLMKDNNILTGLYVIDKFNFKVAFVGKIFVVGYNGFDDVCSLSDNEIIHLLRFVKKGKLFIL